uniref:Conserved oligomeric Golgi complex subunit 8 n=1 Tax=Hucho hucho TaxID=62062 RepID=A0A4W5JRN2_9TELE
MSLSLSLFRRFVKEAEDIGVSRRMNSLTLNRHTEILEILEIPQLMDTCVRNGYYEEALELAAYVKRLEKKHSSLPVIQVSMLELPLPAYTVVSLVTSSLSPHQVTKSIVAFHRAEETAFSSREKELFVQFCCSFAEDMVPFLHRCLQVLFPPAQLSVILGVPPTQVHKYSSLGCIDVSAVLEPLGFVLPEREMVTPVVEDLSVELEGLTTADPEPTLPDPEPIAGPEPIEEDPMVSSTISTEFVSETGLTSDPELEAILNDPNPVLDDPERPRDDRHREVQEDPELEAILNPPKPVLSAPEHNPVPESDSEPSETEEVAES